jgi:hypothetical protein
MEKGSSVTCDRSVVLSSISPRYNWNIVKSGVKHHNPNPSPVKILHLKCVSSFMTFKCTAKIKYMYSNLLNIGHVLRKLPAVTGSEMPTTMNELLVIIRVRIRGMVFNATLTIYQLYRGGQWNQSTKHWNATFNFVLS